MNTRKKTQSTGTEDITFDEMIKNMEKTANCILCVIIGLPIAAILIIFSKVAHTMNSGGPTYSTGTDTNTKDLT